MQKEETHTAMSNHVFAFAKVLAIGASVSYHSTSKTCKHLAAADPVSPGY